jgi:hypothetical protein
MASLAALHRSRGWGTLEEWLTYLRGLYVRSMPYTMEEQARNVPNPKWTVWIPSVWGRIARS